MVSKTEVLDGDWQLLRIEVTDHEDVDGCEAFDGYSRFWCKQAVLGAYWVVERVGETKIRIHLTEDIELEGFTEPLSFKPDQEFKRELLARCNWEEVVRQIFPEDQPVEINTSQLPLFGPEED